MEPTVPDEDRPLELDPLRPPSPLTWRDRLAEAAGLVASPGRALACAVLVVGVAVAAFAVLRPAPTGPAPELSIPMASSGPSAAPASTQPATLVVHAAGAVNAPGLYELAAGSRVNDVIAAAGGLAAGADADRVNLAAPVADGERVYIPKVGEAVPAAEGPSVDGYASNGSATSGPVNLNTASVEELDTLPGIGPSIAQAIVDERERNGPFRSVDDLERVRGIGPSKLDQLRDLVTV
jgi:competence protein ComEA